MISNKKLAYDLALVRQCLYTVEQHLTGEREDKDLAIDGVGTALVVLKEIGRMAFEEGQKEAE